MAAPTRKGGKIFFTAEAGDVDEDVMAAPPKKGGKTFFLLRWWLGITFLIRRAFPKNARPQTMWIRRRSNARALSHSRRLVF